MLNVVYKILRPLVSHLMLLQRSFRNKISALNTNHKMIMSLLKRVTLGKMVMLALVAVVIFYSLGIYVSNETLNFLQKDLFFKPLGLIIPFLIGTAMFAVPQRIPVETLATIGISVIATYLITTIIASSMGYQSVVIFNTHRYIEPLLSKDIQAEARKLTTDFTLLYIIIFSLIASFIVSHIVKKHHKLHEQITFISLFLEKLAYRALSIILWMMPLAVFASIMMALQTHGIDKLSSLGWFVLYVNIPQTAYLILLILLLKTGSGTSIGFSFNAIKKLAKIAIPSSSSAATILTNVETARSFPILSKYKNKGLIASLMPFGATVNMSGTALFITIMCKIAANIQGLDIGFWDIIPYAVIYSCAAAAIPSASIVLITAIFQIIGIEISLTVQILGLMIAVDWINDRVRTLINVSGDLVAIVLSLNERSPLQIVAKLFK